ncbi:hypothetical protein GALL_541060 [mine drainage metagenome]|uniref:Uncharacterized protein n=1 Tax=mine drainage metagenome TaxID=410659 RepID=A0A1J5P191_9ZZZZ
MPGFQKRTKLRRPGDALQRLPGRTSSGAGQQSAQGGDFGGSRVHRWHVEQSVSRPDVLM